MYRENYERYRKKNNNNKIKNDESIKSSTSIENITFDDH